MIELKEKFIITGGYLIGMLLPIPLLNIVAVQAYWLFFRGYSIFIDHHLKGIINFLISIQIYVGTTFLLGYILNSIPDGIIPSFLSFYFFIVYIFSALGMIGIFTFSGAFVYIVLIIGIIATFIGKYFRFPLTIKFIK